MKRYFITGGLFAVVVCIAFWSSLPSGNELEDSYPITWADAQGVQQIRFQTQKPSNWKTTDAISKLVRGAIIVSEDWAFFEHHGVDFRQLRLALRDSIKQRQFVRGASTITQQLARNLYLTKEKHLWRKFKELLITLKIERRFTKEKILETYLNIIEFGPSIYGIGKASQHYFGKAPDELEANEAAFLAMLLPNPKVYKISFDEKNLTPYAKETIQSILKKMVQAGYLSDEEAEGQLAELDYLFDKKSQSWFSMPIFF